jgi:rhamnosyltransferase
LKKNNFEYKSVLVLLSTYNGESFLREQLDSLFNQKGILLQILVRDDGSTDNTRKILHEYLLLNTNLTVLMEHNIGCTLSFNKLMSYALSLVQKFDYYAFSDQDDVWDDNKLLSAVECLERNENELKLYYSSYRVVDENLSFKHINYFSHKHTLGEALIMINTIGCTMVFTNLLMEKTLMIEEVKNFKASGYPNHDGWMYLTAMVFNTYLYYDPIPRINYRQHRNNVVGAFVGGLTSRIKRIVKNKRSKSQIANILLNTFQDIDMNNKDLLRLNAKYRDSIKIKFKLFFSKKMITESFKVNLAYRVLLFFNWY